MKKSICHIAILASALFVSCSNGIANRNTGADSLEVVESDTIVYFPDSTLIIAEDIKIDKVKANASQQIITAEEKPHKTGYNPPKARDLSTANKRECQLWGAFDRGMIAGYNAGYKDGKQNKLYHSFNSSYPTTDQWIEQSYIQGYEVGYLDGFDDAGGSR